MERIRAKPSLESRMVSGGAIVLGDDARQMIASMSTVREWERYQAESDAVVCSPTLRRCLFDFFYTCAYGPAPPPPSLFGCAGCDGAVCFGGGAGFCCFCCCWADVMSCMSSCSSLAPISAEPVRRSNGRSGIEALTAARKSSSASYIVAKANCSRSPAMLDSPARNLSIGRSKWARRWLLLVVRAHGEKASHGEGANGAIRWRCLVSATRLKSPLPPNCGPPSPIDPVSYGRSKIGRTSRGTAGTCPRPASASSPAAARRPSRALAASQSGGTGG